MLDPALAAQLPPLVLRAAVSRLARPDDSPGTPQRRAVRDDLFAGLINSDSEDEEGDEDWAADLEREKKLQVARAPLACAASAGWLRRLRCARCPPVQRAWLEGAAADFRLPPWPRMRPAPPH
jgi:hypothetical protein